VITAILAGRTINAESLRKLNVYRRQRLKPKTRCGHQAASTPQLPHEPLPQQPVPSKFGLLNISTLTPEGCIAKYPNAGAVVHEEFRTKSAVLLDGRGRNPTETTQHGLGSASEEAYVGYVDLVPEVDCGVHGHPGWQDRLAKEKANQMQSFLRSVTDDGENIVVQVAAAMSGLHNHLPDMGPLLLEGVSSHHIDHPTRKTAEQARHVRALKQDLYKLAVDEAFVVTAAATVEGKFSAVNQRLVGGYCFDIDSGFYKQKHDEHDNFERQLLVHLNQSDSSEHRPFIAVSVNAIRVFQIAWRILFDEEFHPKNDADTGLHECMLACKADCKYIRRLAEYLGKSNQAGPRTQLFTTKRL
jgi:hypothetical protein